MPSLSEIVASRRAAKGEKRTIFKKENDPGYKVYDFYLPKEEQKQEELKSGSTVTDILDFIDNLNRPMYAITGGAKEFVKSIKEGESPAEIGSDVVDSAIKGLKREERTSLRDVVREAAPDALKFIEDNTKFKVFGVEADAASIPLFIGEIAVDPLTYVPFGAPIKLLKGAASKVVDPATKIAKSIIGAELADKIARGSSKVLDEVAYHTSKTKYAKRIQARLEKEGLLNLSAPDATRSIEDYFRGVNRSGTIAEKKVKSASFLKQVGKIMNQEQSEVLGGWMFKMNDEAIKLFDGELAKTYGLQAEDLSKVYKVDDLMSKIGISQAPEEKTALLSELNDTLGIFKGAKAKGITEAMVKEKGFRGLVKDLVNLEDEQTKVYLKQYFEGKREIKKMAIKEIDGQIDSIRKSFKADSRTVSKMFKHDVNNLGKELKGIDNHLNAFVKGKISDEAIPLIEENLGRISQRLDFLNKYQIAETSAVYKTIKTSSKRVSKDDLMKLAENQSVAQATRDKIGQLLRLRSEGSNVPMTLRRQFVKREKSLLSEIVQDKKAASILKPKATVDSFFTTSAEKITNVKKAVNEISSMLGRARFEGADEISKETALQLQGLLKGVKNEMRGYIKSKAFQISKIKESADVAQAMLGETTGKFAQELNALKKSRDSLVKSVGAEIAQEGMSKVKLQEFKNVRANQYYKAFKAISGGEASQRIYRSMKGEFDNIFAKGLKELPEELREPAAAIRGALDEAAGQLKDLDLLKGENPLYTPRRLLEETIDKVANRMSRPGTSTPFLKGRKFRYYSELKEWAEKNGGQVKTDIQVVLLDYFKNVEMKQAKTILEKNLLARFKANKVVDLPPKIQSTLNYFYREGKTNFGNEVTSGLFGVLGNLQNKAKALLTVINPAFHTRNVMGFPLLAATTAGMKAGFNPKNYVDAIALMTGAEGKLVVKQLGKEVAHDYNAIREAAELSGYFSSSFLRGDIQKSAKTVLGRYSKLNPMHWMGKFFQASAHLEDMGRYGALVANLRSGKPLEEALSAAKKAMFDYNLINSPVDKAMQGIFGFYTFTRKNLPQQVATLFNDPKQYAIISRALNKITNQEELSDEELSLLNNYEKGTFKVFGQVVDGVRNFRSLGFFPAEEAYQTFSGLTHGDFQERMRFVGARVNPVLKSFLDFYYGKDSFYGSELPNSLPSKYDVLPDKVIDVLGLKRVRQPKYRGGEIVGEENVLTGPKSVIFAIRSLPTSRFINDMLTAKSTGDMVGYLAGMKNKELDVDARKFFRKKAVQKRLNERIKERGGKIFETPYIPKNQKKRKIF